MTRAYIAVRTRMSAAADKETGATAVEYGLMVALIALAIIVSVTLLGVNLDSRFNQIAVAVGAA
jgi:pilus assembly protein Flp/PilA